MNSTIRKIACSYIKSDQEYKAIYNGKEFMFTLDDFIMMFYHLRHANGEDSIFWSQDLYISLKNGYRMDSLVVGLVGQERPYFSLGAQISKNNVFEYSIIYPFLSSKEKLYYFTRGKVYSQSLPTMMLSSIESVFSLEIPENNIFIKFLYENRKCLSTIKGF